MTDEEKKAVEKAEAEAAAAKALEEAGAPTELELKLEAQDILIKKLSAEKENYRKGMLKAKGKVTKEEEEDEEEDLDTKVSRLVQEKLLDTQIQVAQQEKDTLLKNALARNKELETAIKNRSQIATAGSGSSSESKFTVKDNTLSEEKLAKLKAMGWDDKKITRYKETLLKMK